MIKKLVLGLGLIVLFGSVNHASAITSSDKAKLLAAGFVASGSLIYWIGLKKYSPNLKYTAKALIFTGMSLGAYCYYPKAKKIVL